MGEIIKILVTGAEGQLGKCLHKVVGNYPRIEFDFRNKSALDITITEQVRETIRTGGYDYCINAAAYTNVDEAERNPEPAYAVNVAGVEILVNACQEFGVCLIHISTDYVFDGEKVGGYTPDDMPNPINAYGKSKWEGEKIIQAALDRFFIVRTSWLYSEYGENFYKKILEKARRGETLYVTDAQIGCPTDANHLAQYILSLIIEGRADYGIKHYTDGEPMSWYGFAQRILQENGLEHKVKVVRDNNYRSFAARPRHSVLSKE